MSSSAGSARRSSANHEPPFLSRALAELPDQRGPAWVELRLADVARDHQGVIHLVGGIGDWPGFAAHALDRRRIERAEIVGAAHLGRTPRIDGARAPLFERRVVEERVDGGIEQLVAEHRRLGRVARNRLDLAPLEPLQLVFEAVQVDCFFERVSQRLGDQRMVGNFACAR